MPQILVSKRGSETYKGWYYLSLTRSHSYKCGYCGIDIASDRVYYNEHSYTGIFICPHCGGPSFFCNNTQIPSPSLGKKISHLPETIEYVYNEIRSCCSHNSPTAAIMLARKLIMHIAVHHGAEEDKRFVYYTNFLIDNGLVTKPTAPLLERIKDLGNEANHEITNTSMDNALLMLNFIEVLLINNYEYPGNL